MAEINFQNELGRDVEIVRIVSVGGQQQRQYVESGAGTAPSQFHAYFREFYVEGIPEHATVRLLVTGVTDQLTVPYAKVVTAVRSLWKDRYGGSEKLQKRRCRKKYKTSKNK